jgi:hypothetical protein
MISTRLGWHRTIEVAACFACVLLSLAACSGGASRPPRDAGPVTIEAVSPRGAVTWPVVFQWKTTAPATAVCRVTVFDVAERQLLQFETKGSRLDAPEDLRKVLPVTKRFLWRVSVENENGADAVLSSLVEFEVK